MEFSNDGREAAEWERAEFTHELRNSLATLKSAVNLFDRAFGDPEMFVKVKAALFREVDKMSLLIDRSLQVDAVNSGKPVVPREADVPSNREPAFAYRAVDAVHKRILLADDNHDALMTLAMVLKFEGHDVVTASDGDEALAVAEATHPDVVLLDIGMPIKDGFEVAKLIGEQPWSAHCKLIALSGWGRAEDKEKALAAGFHAHLIKPVDMDALAALLTS